MFQRKTVERRPTAACSCGSFDFVPKAPVMRSDAAGMWQVGSVVECFQCRKEYAIVEGKVSVPSWISERNKAREMVESHDSSRDRRKETPPSLRERDLKWG